MLQKHRNVSAIISTPFLTVFYIVGDKVIFISHEFVDREQY